MNCPRLTIALQTYNRSSSGYLRESLDAILAQSYADFELLVLDNHSSDDTAELVLNYTDSRLTYIRQPPGGTSANNFYRAIWMSRGVYVLPTHDDDIMEPTMVERQMDFLNSHPETLCVATNVSLIDQQGLMIQPHLYAMEEDLIFEKGEYIPFYMEEKFWLPTPSHLFHRDALASVCRKRVRDTNQIFFPSDDIWTLFRMNLRGSIAILAPPLLRYRQHFGQESRSVDQSAPLTKLIDLLLKQKQRSPVLLPHLPCIHAAHARFHAQDILFRSGSMSRELIRQIHSLGIRWKKAVPPANRAVDAVLPFELLHRQLNLGATIPDEKLDQLQKTPARSLARQSYRLWAHLANEGQTIFEGKPEFRRVAILGSMLTAFLLVLDARRAGIEVACCLDSSPARIGQQVLGVPIIPHEQLRGVEAVDAVILSSERDHEEALKEILTPHLPDRDLRVLSWKDLAREAMPRLSTAICGL
ncbi:MAG: glycosyltransferase [Syntrophobacteraceae bacterium]